MRVNCGVRAVRAAGRQRRVRVVHREKSSTHDPAQVGLEESAYIFGFFFLIIDVVATAGLLLPRRGAH